MRSADLVQGNCLDKGLLTSGGHFYLLADSHCSRRVVCRSGMYVISVVREAPESTWGRWLILRSFASTTPSQWRRWARHLIDDVVAVPWTLFLPFDRTVSASKDGG